MKKSIYDSCKAFFSQDNTSLLPEEQKKETNLIQTIPFLDSSTIPVFLKKDFESGYFNEKLQNLQKVFYVSDLHLVYHIFEKYPQGFTDKQVLDYIKKVVVSLYKGNFEKEVKKFKKPIVIFAGDISSVFSVSEIFYKEFVEKYKEVEHKSFLRHSKTITPWKEEIKRCNERINEWKRKHPWTSRAKRPLTEYDSVPESIKNDFSSINELENKIFKYEVKKDLAFDWEKKHLHYPGHKFIFTVLGNHEFWDFKTYEECVATYTQMFDELNVLFLNSSSGCFGGNYSEESKNFSSLNSIIAGGVGFAENNKSFNAKQSIYLNAIDEEKEKQLSKEWVNQYRRAVDFAKDRHATLLVVTHMPISDWLPENEKPSNCVFINGHTHRNLVYQDEKNFHIFADNQIGYTNNCFKLKEVLIYKPRNPFANDPDGYREISVSEYIELNLFMKLGVQKVGIIEKQIKDYGRKLFVIKKQGYYGFFMTAPKATYICNGGMIKKIGHEGDLSRYNDLFMSMVNLYISALTPLRKAQEEISEIIKDFGGDGTIHGCIVDIDFYNHIMINPQDGTLTFYYSPFMGAIMQYSDLQSLIHEQCPNLEKRFLEKKSYQLISLEKKVQFENVKKLELVDIKNSQYAISRRIQALQRLFEKHILRDWDNDLLQKFLSNNKSLPECKLTSAEPDGEEFTLIN